MGGDTSKISKKTAFSPETVRHLRKMYNNLLKKTDLSTEDLYLNFDIDQELCDMLFKALDRDGDGTVKFSEFTLALHLLGPASLEEKIDFCFELYDLKGNGCLSQKEYKDASLNTIYTMDELRRSFDRMLDGNDNDDELIGITKPSSSTSTSTSTSSPSSVSSTSIFPPSSHSPSSSSSSSPSLNPPPPRNNTSAHQGTQPNEAKRLILNGFMETAFSISETLKKEASLLEIQQQITETFLKAVKLDEKGNITSDEFKSYAKQHPEVLMTLIHLRKCLLEILHNKRRRKQQSGPPGWSFETFSLT